MFSKIRCLYVFLFVVSQTLLPNSAHTEETSSKLKIGIILPLTGDFSFFGDSVQKGAEIALFELKQEGRNIDLVYDDERCLPQPAVAAYKNMTTVKKVDAIIGPGCSGSILAIAPLAKASNTKVLALLDSNNKIRAAGGVAAFGYSSEIEGELVADEINKRNLKRVAVICETDAWAEIICEAFRNRFKSGGGTVVADESHSVDNHDYRLTIQKVMQRNPEAIYFVPAYNGGLFLKQKSEIGNKVPVFGPDTFGVQEVLDIAGAAAEGVIYTNVDLVPENAVQQKFMNSYVTRYGKNPTSFYYAALGYDALRIVVRALGGSSNNWSESLRSLKYNDGVIPDVVFDKDLMSQFQPVLLKISEGKFVRLYN